MFVLHNARRDDSNATWTRENKTEHVCQSYAGLKFLIGREI